MPKTYKLFFSKAPGGKRLKGALLDIEDIVKAFGAYKVKQIELWVSGAVETGQLVKFIISAKGEGGIKVTLIPKSSVSAASQRRQ